MKDMKEELVKEIESFKGSKRLDKNKKDAIEFLNIFLKHDVTLPTVSILAAGREGEEIIVFNFETKSGSPFTVHFGGEL